MYLSYKHFFMGQDGTTQGVPSLIHTTMSLYDLDIGHLTVSGADGIQWDSFQTTGWRDKTVGQ